MEEEDPLSMSIIPYDSNRHIVLYARYFPFPAYTLIASILIAIRCQTSGKIDRPL